MTEEEWREVPGWPGYAVSDHGRVASWRRGGRLIRLKLRINRKGYRWVSLIDGDGKPRTMYVHRLVLMAFVGPCPDGQEACHGDDDPSNNYLANLSWGTHLQNVRDGIARNGHHNGAKTRCPRDHEYDEENTMWRGGRRRCRTCHRQRAMDYRDSRRRQERLTNDAGH